MWGGRWRWRQGFKGRGLRAGLVVVGLGVGGLDIFLSRKSGLYIHRLADPFFCLVYRFVKQCREFILC